MSKNTRTRILLTAVAALLLVAMTVGGTLAWLIDTTDPVTNTFTTAGIDIDLYETKLSNGTEVDPFTTGWSAQLIPGKEYAKNPVVVVDDETTDVEIYLFVKFEEVGNVANYIDYTSNLTTTNGWTQLSTETANGTITSIWYRTVAADAANSSWELLDDNKVTIKNIDKDMTDDTGMSLQYTAYAIQTAGFDGDVEAAWDAIN